MKIQNNFHGRRNGILNKYFHLCLREGKEGNGQQQQKKA